MDYLSFEEFLQSKYTEVYMGSPDDFDDRFESWMNKLNLNELLKYGNEFGKWVLKNISDQILPDIGELHNTLLDLKNSLEK